MPLSALQCMKQNSYRSVIKKKRDSFTNVGMKRYRKISMFVCMIKCISQRCTIVLRMLTFDLIVVFY
jgi:hypothetical protein